MKKIMTILATVGIILVLAACGADNADDLVDQNGTQDEVNSQENNDASSDNAANNAEDNTNNASNAEDNTDTNAEGDSMMDQMKAIAIEEIEIEVEYADHKEYEAEIERDSHSDDGYEAELEDDLNDEYLKGQDAFDKIYPMVKKLDIDENTSKDDAIKQVLEAFDLPDDYEEIEIEIDLWDFDHEIEFEEKK